MDTLSQTTTSAIVTFAENNGSELILGPVDVEHNTAGRIIGHTGSIVQGVAEIAFGQGLMAAGGTEAIVTAPACATGVGCLVPAAGAGTILAGSAVTMHGGAVIANTVLNMTGNGAGSSGGNPAKKYHLDGRGKIQTGADAVDQLEGITIKQDNLKKGKGKGIVDSTKKSEQRVDNKNNKIRNLDDAYDEYPDY